MSQGSDREWRPIVRLVLEDLETSRMLWSPLLHTRLEGSVKMLRDLLSETRKCDCGLTSDMSAHSSNCSWWSTR